MVTITRTNEDIKRDVVDQLFWDTRVDASNVKVEVSDGKVTLTGTVPDYTASQAASEDAWEMAGVRYVQNDQTIKYPVEEVIPSDADIKKNLENLLLWQPNIDSTDIRVSVDNGWVKLTGSVDAYWKKVRCEGLALGINGVVGLTSEVAVVPTKDVSDKIIADDILAAMERNIQIDVDLIDVQVENGQVTLNGTVYSLPAFNAARRIAENTFGVLNVDNQLSIR